MLPKAERRTLDDKRETKIWVYGGAMTGKTTYADKYPMPLMLNTDGNTGFVTAPVVLIEDKVEYTGRIKNTTLAWEYFKDVISDLERGEDEFETVVLDLVEDLYEDCRQYIYNREKIKHESDQPFKAWDMVTNEFLRTIQRVVNLEGKHIVLISHEDTTRDITKESGDNITQIKPNIRDKVAFKLAGMVDAVGRIVIEEDKRYISFKTDNVTFGGGRIPNLPERISLEFDEFKRLYLTDTK